MNNINDLREQFENLIKRGQELLEKMKENQNSDVSKKVRWMPKNGECYYVVNGGGEITSKGWGDDIYDEGCYNLNNVFKTEEDAHKELDRRLAEQELLDMVDAKTSDENDKWFIEYDPRGPVFYPNNTVFRLTTPFLFATEESCQQAINTLGEDKLKLIFRIN